MRRTPLLVPAVLLIVGIAIGKPLVDRHDPTRWEAACNGQVYLALQLAETPQPRTKSFRAKARVERVDGRRAHGDITLYLKRDSAAAQLRYGDRLLLHGYPDTLQRSIYITSDHYLVTARDSTSLRARAEGLRLHLLHRMQQGPLDPRHAGIAEALVLGWRGDLEPGVRTAFRDSGILHLLCVSGLHVGLVAAMVGGLLFWLGKERKWCIVRGAVQLLAVWGFVLTSGLAPPSVRAALMFSLLIVSRSLARRTDSLNLLAATAIVMLCARPSLLFDLGWQLSFSAVGGILMAQPVLRSFRFKLTQSLTASTAATLGSLPIILATFHRLPLYFLVANLAIAPYTTLLMLLALAYAALPCPFTASLLGPLLRLTDWLTAWIASIPYAVIEPIEFAPLPLALLTVAVVAVLLGPRLIIGMQNRYDTQYLAEQ